MLLALPLFVVVVGVDPRWMENSLHEHFGSLLSNNGAGEVTPAAYLEKIFQVPFKLKEVDAEGFSLLVDSQFPKKEASNQPVSLPSNGAGGANNQRRAKSKQTGPLQPTTVTGFEVKASDVNQLIISDDERDFIKLLQEIIPMVPRTIKRYVNIYRIIRSHGDFKFTDGQKLQYCKVAMFLLAIMLSLPEKADVIFGLIRSENNSTTFGAFLKKDLQVEKIGSMSKATTAFFLTREGKALEKIKINYYKENLPLIERFSLNLTK